MGVALLWDPPWTTCCSPGSPISLCPHLWPPPLSLPGVGGGGPLGLSFFPPSVLMLSPRPPSTHCPLFISATSHLSASPGSAPSAQLPQPQAHRAGCHLFL